jgi:hypothetical protein
MEQKQDYHTCFYSFTAHNLFCHAYNSTKEISVDISAYEKFLSQIPNKAGSLAIAIAASLPGQAWPDTQQETISLPYGDETHYEESQITGSLCVHMETLQSTPRLSAKMTQLRLR